MSSNAHQRNFYVELQRNTCTSIHATPEMKSWGKSYSFLKILIPGNIKNLINSASSWWQDENYFLFVNKKQNLYALMRVYDIYM